MGRPSIASREARPPLAYAATAVGLVAATALGFFARPDTPHLVIAALGLAVTGAKLFRVGTAGPLSRRDGLEVGLLLTTLGAILVQATGGLDSALRPVQYLLLALLAAQLELAVTVAMALLAGGLLAAPLLGTGLLAARSTTLLSETATLLVFAVVVGGFVRWERKSREEATRRLKRLTEETEALAQETDDIEGLKADSSPARRERERRLRELRNVLDAQVHRALETSRAALAAQGVVYYRLDGEKLTLLDAIAESDHLVESVDARAGFFAGAIKSRRPVTLPDVTGSGVPYYRKEAGVRSVMVVPLQQGDDVRGLLIADHKEADRFGKAHAEVLSGLGAMIGELEHGGRERERHQKFQDRLQQLVEVSRALQDSLAPEALAEKALAAAQELARFDFALVATEGGRDRFTISTAAGLDNGRLAGKDAPTGETLVGWVLRNRVYLNVPRFRSRSVKTPLLGRRLDPDGVRAALIFPMVRQEGEAVGAFVFGSTTRESFTADEFEMLELVVRQASLAMSNAVLYRRMEELATTDGLTALNNHRFFQEHFLREVERAQRQPKTRFALVLSDIDHFKKVNDGYGHPAGDEVLRRVGKIFASTIQRKTDLAARYGGEEFALVLADTDAAGARAVIDKVRAAVAKEAFEWEGRRFQVTMSAGVISYPDDIGIGSQQKAPQVKQTLIDRADKALYASKEGGRNRSTLWREIAPETGSGAFRTLPARSLPAK